jgi:ABC-type glycerol-3-phosphate transport system substrate-binding protein
VHRSKPETTMRRLILALIATAAVPAAALAQMAPSPDAPPDSPPPAGAPASPDHTGGMMQKMQDRFNEANTTHDGHLTLAQAQAANFSVVSDNFTAIDTKKRGYVTFNDIIAWHLDQEAQHLEQRAESLRAQD